MAAATVAAMAAAAVAAMAPAVAATMAEAAVAMVAVMVATEAAKHVRKIHEILDYSANIWLNKKAWASFNILSKANSLLTEVKKNENKHIFGGRGVEFF